MLTKSNILIVDDNPINRKVINVFLNNEGYSVLEAKNGEEALEKIKQTDFNLIFMDLLMPVMDGFETTRKIRNMGVSTPIIAASALSLKQDRQRAIESGCNDFLSKPIDFAALSKLVKRYNAENSSSHKQLEIQQKHDLPASSEDMRFSDCKVLLVEEDEGLGAEYETMLSKHGFDVKRISNGTQALKLIQEKENKVDIIISNIFTSGIDALGLLTIAKREYPGILVFIYTGEYDTDTFQVAIQQGVDGIIPQKQFEHSVFSMIESAIYNARQKGSRARDAATVKQVRKAQEQLLSFGCQEQCRFVDVAQSALHEAGGDMACCRRFNLEGLCGIVLADVAGHDVTSSYMSAVFLGMMTSNWDAHHDPLDFLKSINADLIKLGNDRSHICATVLLWDKRRKKIKIAVAGNPGGLHVVKNPGNSVAYTELSGGGMGLGLLSDDSLFVSEEIKFEKGSCLFFFSDGIEKDWIIDAVSEDEKLFRTDGVCGHGQKILSVLQQKHVQEDDMILLSLNVPEQINHEEQHYELLSDFSEIDKACKWAEKILTPDKIPGGKDRDFILLSLREALLNAVEYGNNHNPLAYVDLSLFYKPGELKINVSDEGSGFELAEKINELRNLDGLQLGRRGLLLMNEIADVINVTGGTVSMVFKGEKTGTEGQRKCQMTKLKGM